MDQLRLIRLVGLVGLVGSGLCSHKSSGLRALGLLRLILGRSDDKGDRVAKFHDIVHKDLDVVSAGNFEFDLTEKGDVGGIEGGIFEGEFYFAFS